jgi:biotin carboxylase
VLKPLTLSASRGVIRANDAEEFTKAFRRIKKILEEKQDSHLQVEHFIPGREFALEGLVTAGRLQVLALFDKPDPLDGPFFEETIYLTPSRETEEVQQSIFEAAQRAVTALGLTDGPVHAEMRVNESGVWMLEVAARPIGGLCSQVLKFDDDSGLEEIVLRHALGEDVRHVRLAPGAHGVMMIPIPRAGVYSGVEGLDCARRIPGIEDVLITAKEGQTLAPLPEGASYLGFLFARGASPKAVEQALRNAHGGLEFRVSTALRVVR